MFFVVGAGKSDSLSLWYWLIQMSPMLIQSLTNGPRVEELTDDPVLLKRMLEEVLKLFNQAQGCIEQLGKHLERMLKRLYGRSREKWHPDQMLMNELLAKVLEQRQASEEMPSASVKVEAHTRHVIPHGRSVLPETLKHEEVGVAAAVPASEPVAKGLLDNRLLADLVVSKYVDHLPLYRLEKNL